MQERNDATFRHHSSLSPALLSTWVLPASVVVMWTGISFLFITTKCLLTAQKCTRWGPEHPLNFPHPMTISALNLSIAGMILFLILVVKDVGARQRPRLLSMEKFRMCSTVGVIFGMKNIMGLVALKATPIGIYMLFHALNIVFIALAAWIVVGERPTKVNQYVALVGVVLGSAITSSESFFGSGIHSVGLVALVFNIVNSILAGATVATLRWTALRIEETNLSIAEMTCLQLVIGATVTLPVALIFDGRSMLTINSSQWFWILMSSVILFAYHLALSFVCFQTSSLVIGIIEAVKPLPAFIIMAIIQKLPENSWFFWFGSSVTLTSAVWFKVSQTMSKDKLPQSGSSRYLLTSVSVTQTYQALLPLPRLAESESKGPYPPQKDFRGFVV